jgi:hypothetical protein
MVAKSLPRKQVRIKNFHQNFWSKIFMVEYHYLENRFKPNIGIKILWSKIFYGCKIINSKTCLNQRFPPNIFGFKIFFGCKIITSKTGLNQKFFVGFFLWLQNNFLGTWFAPKIIMKNFSVENVYGCKILTSKSGLKKKFHQNVWS